MSLEILKPGLLTTIQDLGRYGHQKEGIIVSGAMDTFALRVANMLVGNPQHQAALEITLTGPTIRFTTDQLIALTGADLSPALHGEAVKMWRPLFVKQGSILEFKSPQSGCRAYLAVSGGFAIPEVLGSYATYLKAGFGGFGGRALQAGDLIPCHAPTGNGMELFKMAAGPTEGHTSTNWTPDPQRYPNYQPSPTIRAIKGPEYELFSETAKERIWSERFQVSVQSDRMGYRLQGVSLYLQEQTELISSAVTFGTVQVPPDGQPIVLMADHQTTGGYPRIAQVISADLPILAQVVPGQTIQLQEVTLEEAQQLYIRQEQNLELLARAIHLKRNP
ncbi:biotin-dependent carboxyltransferase family protein [Pontibacter sp. JH31]|uniref:Biotin-dependent carboxyltransferase family protein n=1 Tax=Pontibacter aquaedesilientis TaxID=2766980 RepID=A0ABR7XJQ1_9BACT|nr:biotin-dependent carboxyltransferase family protein [Pontibacter aquaedesilientis]MBD1398483.1 biotin-dependent carboxyltransferase family protein [Pontibacter aquaedesilientis]